MKKNLYSCCFKRFLDVVAALVLLTLLAPLLLLTIIFIRLDSRGPVFFRQKRMGRNGAVFNLLKFRTMTHRPRAVTGEVFLDNSEITRVGRWLRRYKVDELPQLINVLTGDMSLVGPRPALPEQRADYTELACKRLWVRPGLTGLAQVNGNIFLTWPERWAYDAQYVENLSLALDLKILLRTFAVVLKGEERFVNKKPAGDAHGS